MVRRRAGNKGSATICGKFTQMSSWEQVHAFSQPLVARKDGDGLVVSTPMRPAHIMRLNAAGGREMAAMRWGFAGHDDANPSRPKHMHVRAETIDQRRTFAQAFATSRGILMVHTFNEGEELPTGKTRQWVITPNDGEPVAVAVIFEEWHNGPESLLTFVMVTTPPNALIARITDRMPAILPRATWPAWLGETDASPAQVKALLQTYEDGGVWTMEPQATSRPARARKPSSDQGSLF
ncbi:MAG TPA: SOS response-associated peptidase family protein [Hyphomicrobiaceae bacterium]|nr:SOS response-associated peptidase family protein [Hyphomicrobiaceae bacterium]